LVGEKRKASTTSKKEWNKLQGWEGKLLSQAGGEVLMKSVIQAIPTFTMSCFKLSLDLCNDTKILIKKFLMGLTSDF